MFLFDIVKLLFDREMSIKNKILILLAYDCIIQFITIGLFVIIFFGRRFQSIGLLEITAKSNFVIFLVIIYSIVVLFYQCLSQLIYLTMFTFLTISKVYILRLNLIFEIIKIGFILPYSFYIYSVFKFVSIDFFNAKINIQNITNLDILSNIILYFNPLIYFIICLVSFILWINEF